MDEKITKNITTHRTLGNDTPEVSGIDYETRLWEPFKKTCHTVLREFGLEPAPGSELPAGFYWMRDSEHSATITYHGDKRGGMAEFSIRLTAPHTYGDRPKTIGGARFYAGPALENFGRMTDLALALMLAVRPIAFGKWATPRKHLILEAVNGLYTYGFHSTAGHWDDVEVES